MDSNLKSASDEAAAEQAPELVAKLGDKVGIPRGLGNIGMKREQLAEMADLASSVKRLLDNSPVAFDRDRLLGLLEEAY
jgi:alcohol dehydrogenase class IV